jgi:predicted ATPase
VQICRLAAGLPLAIELAALLAGHLPLAEIAGTIERNPNALTTTASDLPERHRSMRALFESSWQLLSQAERHILAQCSTFPSSFSFEAALAILGIEPTELRSALAALANQSLLHRSTDGHYELDHLARPFAAEKLAVLSSTA